MRNSNKIDTGSSTSMSNDEYSWQVLHGKNLTTAPKVTIFSDENDEQNQIRKSYMFESKTL